MEKLELQRIATDEYYNYVKQKIETAHDGIRIKFPMGLSRNERKNAIGDIVMLFYKKLGFGLNKKELFIGLTRNTIELHEVYPRARSSMRPRSQVSARRKSKSHLPAPEGVPSSSSDSAGLKV